MVCVREADAPTLANIYYDGTRAAATVDVTVQTLHLKMKICLLVTHLLKCQKKVEKLKWTHTHTQYR